MDYKILLGRIDRRTPSLFMAIFAKPNLGQDRATNHCNSCALLFGHTMKGKTRFRRQYLIGNQLYVGDVYFHRLVTAHICVLLEYFTHQQPE